MRRDESINWRKPEINQGKLCVELFKDKDDQTVLKNIILNNNSQDAYYCNEKGAIMIDHIASFENLEDEFSFLCSQIGINTPTLRHGNKSVQSFNMHDIYNQQLIDLVAKKERETINLKGYFV